MTTDISDRCVFSGVKEDLTLTMVISLNGDDWKVAVSSKYEDTATPGAIKKLITARIVELEDLKVKAEALGMVLITKEKFKEYEEMATKQQIKIIPPTPPPTHTPIPILAPSTPPQTILNRRTVQNTPPEPKSADTTGGITESIDKLVERTTKKDIQQITAPSGRKIIMPRKEVGAAGTTEYQVITTSDKEMKLINDNLSNDNTPSIGKKYTVRDCNSCRGTGKKGTVMCAACKGRGMIG